MAMAMVARFLPRLGDQKQKQNADPFLPRPLGFRLLLPLVV